MEYLLGLLGFSYHPCEDSFDVKSRAVTQQKQDNTLEGRKHLHFNCIRDCIETFLSSILNETNNEKVSTSSMRLRLLFYRLKRKHFTKLRAPHSNIFIQRRWPCNFYSQKCIYERKLNSWLPTKRKTSQFIRQTNGSW